MADREIGPLFSERREQSRPFRLPTGERPSLDPLKNPTGSQLTLNGERGKRIAADVKRGLLLGIILVGVGVILALFVQAL